LRSELRAVDREPDHRYARLHNGQQPESRSRLRVLLSRIRLFWREGVADLKILS